MNRSNVGNVVTNGIQTSNILATNMFDRMNNFIKKRPIADASATLNNNVDFSKAREQYELEQNRKAAVGTKEMPFDRPTYQSKQWENQRDGGFGGYIGTYDYEIEVYSPQGENINNSIKQNMDWIKKRTEVVIEQNPIKQITSGGNK